jgi:tetratricopeptide (TPR) repeat protein
MDRLGNEDAALEIYLEILDHYQPHLYANFERPAIILEKKRRYQEALDICLRALELIEGENISGDPGKCQSRIDKLKDKVDPIEINTPSKGNKKNRKMPSFVFAIIFALGIIAYLVLNSHSQYDDVYVDVSEMDRESELEGSVFKEEDPEEETLPEITQTMIDIAKKATELNLEVTSANVAVNGSTIGFAIFVSPGTSQSKCEEIGKDMVKALGGAASATHLDLTPPSPVSLGGLYAEYDLIVSVGTSSSDLIAKGTKTTSAKKINWRK